MMKKLTRAAAALGVFAAGCLWGRTELCAQNVCVMSEKEAGSLMEVQEVSEQPPGCGVTIPDPAESPAPKLPDADYADIYIQALEQCGYIDASDFDRSFISLDFDVRPELSDEDKERVCKHLQEKGYSVENAAIAQLDKKGLVRRENDYNWILPDGVLVRLGVTGLVQPGRLYVECTVSENNYAGCDRTLVFTEQDGKWKCAENNVRWFGDERYFPEKLLGDVDGNERIDLSDASVILQMALKIVPQEEDGLVYTDMNDDGQITLEDASDVVKCALRIKPPAYYVSPMKDKIFAGVTDSLPEGVWMAETSGEAVEYLRKCNLAQAAQAVGELSPARLANRNIMIVTTSTDAGNAADIESYPYFKTNSSCFHNHMVQELAVKDDAAVSYVQVFLVRAGSHVDRLEVTKESKQQAGIWVITGSSVSETVTDEAVCYTHEQYEKQMKDMEMPLMDDIDEQLFEDNILVFKRAADVSTDADAMNVLHIKKGTTGCEIKIENTTRAEERGNNRENVCYVVSFPRTIASDYGLTVKSVRTTLYGYNKTDGLMFAVKKGSEPEDASVCLTAADVESVSALEQAAQSLGIQNESELKKWYGALKSFDFKQYDAICLRESLELPVRIPNIYKLAPFSCMSGDTLHVALSPETDKTVTGLPGSDVIIIVPVQKGTVPKDIVVRTYNVPEEK